MLRLSVIVIAAAAVAQPIQAQAKDSTERYTSQGAYSEDQAVRGEKSFQAYCASCHELSFHTGEQFRMNWFGRTVWDLFKNIKTTMPEDNIGGLSDDEYTRVLAYIFRLNGFPAATDSLKADSLEMRRIRIGAPAGATDTVRRRNRR